MRNASSIGSGSRLARAAPRHKQVLNRCLELSDSKHRCNDGSWVGLAAVKRKVISITPCLDHKDGCSGPAYHQPVNPFGGSAMMILLPS
jgi:hypothetical protein